MAPFTHTSLKKEKLVNEWKAESARDTSSFGKRIVVNDSYAGKSVELMSRKGLDVYQLLQTRPTKVTVVDRDIEHEFYSNVLKWKEATRVISSSHEIVMNKSYQRIIGLGPAVIPLILKDLRDYGGHWFWALNALTGENPVTREDAGKIKKLRESWLAWGKTRGFI